MLYEIKRCSYSQLLGIDLNRAGAVSRATDCFVDREMAANRGRKTM